MIGNSSPVALQPRMAREARSDWSHKAGMWGATVNRAALEFELSPEARAETLAYLDAIPASAPVASTACDPEALPRLREDLERCRERVDHAERLAILQPPPGLDFSRRRAFAWIVATLLGEPLVQNTDGDRLVGVYARPGTKRIADGARYHQTREGGAPHTDNVSTPDSWEYLVFSCIRAAALGGESILLSAFAVHNELESIPRALEVLQRPFWWEYRGISDALYQAPIVTYSDAGEPRFRYLRRYLESAHIRAAEPLAPEQVWSLDVLDAILELSRLQFRTLMREGEVLITYDSQVLHARTSFADPAPGGARDVSQAETLACRFFDRVWARKRSPTTDVASQTDARA